MGRTGTGMESVAWPEGKVEPTSSHSPPPPTTPAFPLKVGALGAPRKARRLRKERLSPEDAPAGGILPPASWDKGRGTGPPQTGGRCGGNDPQPRSSGSRRPKPSGRGGGGHARPALQAPLGLALRPRVRTPGAGPSNMAAAVGGGASSAGPRVGAGGWAGAADPRPAGPAAGLGSGATAVEGTE